MIRNGIFSIYFLISEFPAKYQTDLTRKLNCNVIVIMKLTGTRSNNIMEIIRLTATVKLQ